MRNQCTVTKSVMFQLLKTAQGRYETLALRCTGPNRVLFSRTSVVEMRRALEYLKLAIGQAELAQMAVRPKTSVKRAGKPARGR